MRLWSDVLCQVQPVQGVVDFVDTGQCGQMRVQLEILFGLLYILKHRMLKCNDNQRRSLSLASAQNIGVITQREQLASSESIW